MSLRQKSLSPLAVGVGQSWILPGEDRTEAQWQPPSAPKVLGAAWWGTDQAALTPSFVCLCLCHQTLSLSTCKMVSLLWSLPQKAHAPGPREGPEGGGQSTET